MVAITDLDPSVPDDSEPAGNGDEEIKRIKQSLRDSFEGQSGDLWDTPLTAGPRALNGISDKVEQTDFDTVESRVSVNELAIVSQANTFTNLDGRITTLEEAGYITEAEALDAAWPVGSVFVSYDGGTPGAKGLPGSWTRFGDGRMLRGSNSGGTGATGGSNTASLSKNNIPKHKHQYLHLLDESGGTPGGGTKRATFGYKSGQSIGRDGDSALWDLYTTEDGDIDGLGAAAFSVLNSYIQVSFYRRTA